MPRVGILIALLGILTASCDTILGPARLGISASQNGQPRILYAPCPGEEIERIALAIVHDNLGGTDDQVLWEIRVTGPESVEPLIVAIPGDQVPAGFTLTVAAALPLPSSRRLTVAVFPSDGSANANTFRLGQLRPGRILTDIDSYISQVEFRALARDTCDNKLDN